VISPARLKSEGQITGLSAGRGKMWLNKVIHSLKRMVNPLVRITNGVAAVILVAMMFLTAMDVLLRYIFNRPIGGAMELTEYMMVILVSLGLAYCAFVKGHVSVEVLTSRFTPKVQAILNCITYFLSFGFFSLITWQSIKYIRLMFESNLVSAVLHIPAFPFIAMLALGSLVFSLVLLADFLDYLSQVVNQ
jgi:TRAP-type C4-dicarboxylate transport system permease small subunit